ncbi:MAG: hypothetical protein HY860_03665 [Chlamydiales bacterium]|nr:hypothetical protein [Chlamydiales bacterium]
MTKIHPDQPPMRDPISSRDWVYDNKKGKLQITLKGKTKEFTVTHERPLTSPRLSFLSFFHNKQKDYVEISLEGKVHYLQFTRDKKEPPEKMASRIQVLHVIGLLPKKP